MKYWITKKVFYDFVSCVKRVKTELEREEFGVMKEINVKEAMNDEFYVDFDNYVIIGSCSRPFEHKVHFVEEDISLFLPCNVIVYELDGEVFVNVIKPELGMGFSSCPKIKGILNKFEEKLERVVERV